MFTPGLEQLIHTIRSPRRSGRVVFPPGLPEGAARRSADEPAHRWMQRCIKEVGGVVVWAEVAWDDWCIETERPNRWERLVQAFKQSNIGVLEADPDLREDLLQLKRCLLRRRRELFPVEIDAVRTQLFGHDSAL